MVKIKENKKDQKEKFPEIDLNLIINKKNGIIFNKKARKPSELSRSQSSPQTRTIESSRKAEISKKESAVSKSDEVKSASDNVKAKVIERDNSLEEHVDFSVGFESTKDSSPIIQERKEKKEEPVKDIEQFLEQVPSPRKKEEDKGIFYEPIDENYLRSYESNHPARKWDEERVADEIREDFQRFEHPGHFREIMPIQDPAITKHAFSEQVKYDLERIDRPENDRAIFKSAFEKKYKSRGKL